MFYKVLLKTLKTFLHYGSSTQSSTVCCRVKTVDRNHGIPRG